MKSIPIHLFIAGVYLPCPFDVQCSCFILPGTKDYLHNLKQLYLHFCLLSGLVYCRLRSRHLLFEYAHSISDTKD